MTKGVELAKKHGLYDPLLSLAKQGAHQGLTKAATHLQHKAGKYGHFADPLIEQGHQQIDQYGTGFGMDLLKTLGPHVLDFAVGQAKNKLSGHGLTKRHYTAGGALFPAGMGRGMKKHKKSKKGKGAVGNVLGSILGSILPF